jgi:DNA-binding MarR family transcriptional regulator
MRANKLGALGVMIADAVENALGEVSTSAAALLLTLNDRPWTTVTELAHVAGIAQPTAVRVLDGIARRGWIERQPRAGRTTPLRLTTLGRKKAKELQSARLGALERLLTGLPVADRRVFDRCLDSLLVSATASRAFAQTTCRLCDRASCDAQQCPIRRRAAELERSAPEA